MPGEARFCPACGSEAARLRPGQVLDGKYEILEKIGEGGMGQVYKARHVHLDEIRIIKITKPQALAEGARRFQEEARIATLVRHPNVAALYDFSRLPDGSYYMVWEFIDGVTLEAWLDRRGPLLASRAIEVARQVLAGLGEIHAQGIVHRDLAPDNIMLKETKDGRLFAKIIDLGIAKRIAGEGLQMTSTGIFLGKLPYCSPEQAGALAPGETVDARSDLYSFGVVLYQMLAGKPPFKASTPGEYLGKHLHAPPPPLDTSRLPSRVGPGLAAIVARALEKQRDRRFSTSQEFAQALAELETPAEPIETISLSFVEPGGRRFPVAWILAALILVSVTAAVMLLKHRATPVGLAPAEGSGPGAPGAPAPSRETPTPGPDELVVAPRIVEQTTSPDPSASPEKTPTATPAPTPAIAPPTPAREARALEVPSAARMTAPELRQWLAVWNSRPIERKAHRAREVAALANSWVVSHPESAFRPELERWLPRILKTDTETALQGARPFLAKLFFRAYRHLSFAPADPELAERVREPLEDATRPR